MADSERPRGERTPTQRLVTYSMFCVLAIVLFIAWLGPVDAGGLREPAGYVIFPLGAVFFAVKAYGAATERRAAQR